MGSKRSKAALGVGTILSVIVYAGTILPEPGNWIVAIIAIILGVAFVLDILDVF